MILTCSSLRQLSSTGTHQLTWRRSSSRGTHERWRHERNNLPRISQIILILQKQLLKMTHSLRTRSILRSESPSGRASWLLQRPTQEEIPKSNSKCSPNSMTKDPGKRQWAIRRATNGMNGAARSSWSMSRRRRPIILWTNLRTNFWENSTMCRVVSSELEDNLKRSRVDSDRKQCLKPTGNIRPGRTRKLWSTSSLSAAFAECNSGSITS